MVSGLVGGIQCSLGGLAAVFAFMLYASPSTREMLAVTQQEVSLYMFITLIFSILSIMSGLLLIRRENSRS